MSEGRSKTLIAEIVLASSRQDDVIHLDALLSGSRWMLFRAETRREAEQAVRSSLLPIVLCDAALEDQPWQETIESLLLARSGACVIMLANASGSDIASEVVRQGGFDLLYRPFNREQLFQSLFFAYSRCRLGWPIACLNGWNTPRIRRGKRFRVSAEKTKPTIVPVASQLQVK